MSDQEYETPPLATARDFQKTIVGNSYVFGDDFPRTTSCKKTWNFKQAQCTEKNP